MSDARILYKSQFSEHLLYFRQYFYMILATLKTSVSDMQALIKACNLPQIESKSDTCIKQES